MASVFGQLGRRNCHIRGPKNGQKQVKSKNFSSIGDDEMRPNIPFSARKTAFQDLWPGFLGNLDTETATFVDHKKFKKRVKPTNCISIVDDEIVKMRSKNPGNSDTKRGPEGTLTRNRTGNSPTLRLVLIH